MGWADRGASGFISLETLLYEGVRTLDPELQTVPAFVADGVNASLVSPAALAAELSNRTTAALALLAQVSKRPSWPRSWANFSPFLYSHRNARAYLHLLGQPNTFLAAS